MNLFHNLTLLFRTFNRHQKEVQKSNMKKPIKLIEEAKSQLSTEIRAIEENINQEMSKRLKRISIWEANIKNLTLRLESYSDKLANYSEMVKKSKQKDRNSQSVTRRILRNEISRVKDEFNSFHQDLGVKFSALNDSFEECKAPLDQQVKRMWYQNISYERELIKYNTFSSSRKDPLQRLEAHSSSQGLKYAQPDQHNRSSTESNLKRRRSSMPICFKKESEISAVQKSFRAPNKILYRMTDFTNVSKDNQILNS